VRDRLALGRGGFGAWIWQFIPQVLRFILR
jgi:hypothetical protein